MRTKPLLFVVVAVIAACGIWFGWRTWTGHRQLVTLRVRNMPLREVLTKVERQTGKKIRAEQAVDTRVTLNVSRKPLAFVLDRLSEQAGARWVTLHAVYHSPKALTQLESALGSEGKIEPAGWTKVAPTLPIGLSGGDGPPGEFESGPMPGRVALPADLPPGAVMATEDVAVKAGPESPPGTRAGDPVHVERRPMVRVVRRAGPGGGPEQQEVWTPEELLLETELTSRAGSIPGEDASSAAAAEMARKVGGRWTTYLVLRKSRLGMNFGGLPGPRPEVKRLQWGGPGAPGSNMNIGIGHSLPNPADIEGELQRQRYAEFGRLTPEQRVQRARDRQQFQRK